MTDEKKPPQHDEMRRKMLVMAAATPAVLPSTVSPAVTLLMSAVI